MVTNDMILLCIEKELEKEDEVINWLQFFMDNTKD
jgi:hypothetical protein